jgi:cell division protease FtsH
MVTKYGMDATIGQRTYAQRPQMFLQAAQDQVVSAAEATGREIDLAVRSLIEDADASARSILEAHRSELEEGVALLIAKETLTVEEFSPLGQPNRGPTMEPPRSSYSSSKKVTEQPTRVARNKTGVVGR